jgi:hypothetical protein
MVPCHGVKNSTQSDIGLAGLSIVRAAALQE